MVNAVQSRTWLTLHNEGEAIILAVIPFFHVYGMTTGMNLGVLIGAELILLPKFHTNEVIEVIEKHHPQIFPGIQAMYLAIGNYPGIQKHDLSSLKVAISGAGPLMREVQDRFELLTGARIVEGYGLSEASPVTHANPIFGNRKIGSIGLPWPDVEARIVDLETGNRTLAQGETGELVVRGPQVMTGYWNKPDETARALRNGWLHTGDIGKMDEDGYFYIVDRIKDMIKTVGENVYPREVEEVLYMHPKVKEAVVVGIPQDFMGEQIKAYIVLKDGLIGTAEEIIGVLPAGTLEIQSAERGRVPHGTPENPGGQGAEAGAEGRGAEEAGTSQKHGIDRASVPDSGHAGTLVWLQRSPRTPREPELRALGVLVSGRTLYEVL